MSGKTSPNPDPAVVGVLLAAGYARRFGSDKRQWPWPGGPTLMEAALRPLQAACARVIVVLPPGDAWGLRLCLRHGTEIAWAFHRTDGLAASLGAAVPALHGSTAAIVALADMGEVQPATLHALARLAHLHPGRLALPVHDGQPGNPRLIPATLFGRLRGLTGDDGVRKALDWQQARRLEVADAGVLRDIDTLAQAGRAAAG